MSEKHKLMYIHKMFKQEALRYYNNNVKNILTNYLEAKRMMLGHLNSSDIQNRIKNELLNLEFKLFLNK